MRQDFVQPRNGVRQSGAGARCRGGQAGTNPTVTVTGIALPGVTVTLYSASGCGGAPVASAQADPVTGSFAIEVTAELGVNTWYATASDDFGESACSGGAFTYTLKVLDPPQLDPGGATSTRPAATVTGTAAPGATVTLCATADCSGLAVAETVADAVTGTFSVDVPAGEGANTWYATAEDAWNVSERSAFGIGYPRVGSAPSPDSSVPVPVVGLVDVLALSARGRRTCALDAYGAIRCWGVHDAGEQGRLDTDPQPFPELVTDFP